MKLFYVQKFAWKSSLQLMQTNSFPVYIFRWTPQYVSVCGCFGVRVYGFVCVCVCKQYKHKILLKIRFIRNTNNFIERRKFVQCVCSNYVYLNATKTGCKRILLCHATCITNKVIDNGMQMKQITGKCIHLKPNKPNECTFRLNLI